MCVMFANLLKVIGRVLSALCRKPQVEISIANLWTRELIRERVSNKVPSLVTDTLVVIGHGLGASGKGWLCCTSSTSPAICVLKFMNDGADWLLVNEMDNWRRVILSLLTWCLLINGPVR
jgi:hypothetical protein